MIFLNSCSSSSKNRRRREHAAAGSSRQAFRFSFCQRRHRPQVIQPPIEAMSYDKFMRSEDTVAPFKSLQPIERDRELLWLADVAVTRRGVRYIWGCPRKTGASFVPCSFILMLIGHGTRYIISCRCELIFPVLCQGPATASDHVSDCKRILLTSYGLIPINNGRCLKSLVSKYSSLFNAIYSVWTYMRWSIRHALQNMKAKETIKWAETWEIDT